MFFQQFDIFFYLLLLRRIAAEGLQKVKKFGDKKKCCW
jgi:hypothetical protein